MDAPPAVEVYGLGPIVGVARVAVSIIGAVAIAAAVASISPAIAPAHIGIHVSQGRVGVGHGVEEVIGELWDCDVVGVGDRRAEHSGIHPTEAAQPGIPHADAPQPAGLAKDRIGGVGR